MTWRDPDSGYVSITQGGGIMQRVLDGMNMDADLGDGDDMMERLRALPRAYRMALADELLAEKGPGVGGIAL